MEKCEGGEDVACIRFRLQSEEKSIIIAREFEDVLGKGARSSL